MESHTLFVITILLTAATYNTQACSETDSNIILKKDSLYLLNKDTKEEVKYLPVAGTSYELALKASFTIMKSPNAGPYTGKVSFRLGSGLKLPCPLPHNICDFPKMTCHEVLEKLVLRDQKCPVAPGVVTVSYPSIGKSPKVPSIILAFGGKVILTVSAEDNSGNTIMCFKQQFQFK